MEKINAEAKAIIDRIEKCVENYGKVFDIDKITKAMQKHYDALGVPMPKIVAIENWEEAFSFAREAAWEAAWEAAFVNTGLKDEATLKFIEIEASMLEALESGLGLFFPMQDCLIITPVPTFRFGQNNLLHSDGLPAVQWKDGKGYHYLNGVRFPKELWETVVSGKMPFQDILAIVDTDQRTQAMRYGNVWEFVKHAKGELLDEHTKFRVDGTPVRYWLYKFPKGEIFTQDAYYALYDDLVPESDKQYMSGVEPCKTVAEALAWKFSDEEYTLTPNDWLLLVPGEHMN